MFKIWSIVFDGSGHPELPTTLAGTPATVVKEATDFKTNEPAATLEHSPIEILPYIFAPAPIKTLFPILGCLSPRTFPVPPRVTECKIETLSPTLAVSPITRL